MSTTASGAASLPDERGHFGRFGGRFIPETLMGPVEELGEAYRRYRDDPEFLAELEKRPAPLCRPAFATVFCRALEQDRRRRPHLF